MLKLVGDNPFNSVSHLSQQTANQRNPEITNPTFAANLVKTSLKNGADGFMFSVSTTTLGILKNLKNEKFETTPVLYAITPAAGEFARGMGSGGGVEGIVQTVVKQMLASRSTNAMFMGLKGALSLDSESLFKSFLELEISKIHSAGRKNMLLRSIMLHEIVLDLALAFDLQWLISDFIEFAEDHNITPGFETRNFCFLVNKFDEWKIDITKVAIAAPFNAVGFQMVPSKSTCEETLSTLHGSHVIAISPLAAGYLRPAEAARYFITRPQIEGVAVAVSKETHALNTFTHF